jgi:type I restriction enzyme S subunit
MMVGKTGLKMPRGDKKTIPNFEIPIPAKKIQQKIAEESEIIDKELETNVRIAEDLRDAISKLADRYYLSSQYSSLGSLCDEPMYGANVPAREGTPDKHYRYIRVTDIDDDGNLKDEWKTAEEVEDKYILQDGDLLFARSGATAGKTFLYDASVGKALYAGYLIKFHPDEAKLLPEFLDLMTRSSNYKQWVIKTRGGTGQPNINAQQFASYMIPSSVKINVQRDAVAKYKGLKQQLRTALNTIDSATSRKQAILDKYLK